MEAGRPIQMQPDVTGERSKLDQIAREMGDVWKSQPYYAEAEAHMDRQWNNDVWPIIKECRFDRVIDLAAGHGRNSEFLRRHAKELIIMDINEENMARCRQRFDAIPGITFVQNDGYSFSTIADSSITLVYCYDAMVHFDSDIVRLYLRETSRTLVPGGHGFFHHSNTTRNPTGRVWDTPGWRNFMSIELFAHYASREGLEVVFSRPIDWMFPGSDAYTLLRKPGN